MKQIKEQFNSFEDWALNMTKGRVVILEIDFDPRIISNMEGRVKIQSDMFSITGQDAYFEVPMSDIKKFSLDFTEVENDTCLFRIGSVKYQITVY